jgi:hypothetical protein
MIGRAAQHAVAGSPLSILAMHGIPWWGVVIAVSCCPVAYICRSYLLYRLASKALDKAPSNQAAAVITALTGHGASDRPRTAGGHRAARHPPAGSDDVTS